LISHDLAAVARASDRAVVLYAGRVVEEARTLEMFRSPQHPYTRGLLACAARPPAARHGGRFPAIGGVVPDLALRASGECAFAPRCPERFARCEEAEPALVQRGSGSVRCFLYEAGVEAGAPRGVRGPAAQSDSRA
jgi:oligopeptide/dipeptide ABC transporter ATP-binding protein